MAKSEKENLEILYPTFGSKRFKQTLKSHKEVLDRYYAGFDEAKSLKGDYKIFLDTNVILRIYSTSFKARGKLLQFFKDYGSRIVLTSQVQWEFVKNRENVISQFNNEVTTTIPDNFNKDIINTITSFRNKNKSKLVDYPDVEVKLEKLQNDAADLLKLISESISVKNISTNEIMYNDDFITEFQGMELLEPLEEKFIKEIKAEFDLFLNTLDKNDIEKQIFKTFPGCYEKKEKQDDPYGDYIIFHEMMKYALEKQKDIIFITEDVTKGDWMQVGKSPHIHYVENFYLNTKKLLYILDGERTFDLLLDINFKSLIQYDASINSFTPINKHTLQHFIDTFPPFNSAKSYPVGDLEAEVIYNGFETIEQIRNVLAIIWHYYPDIVSQLSTYSKVALFRASMTLADDSYEIGSEYGGYNRESFPVTLD
ncbi:PIN-like domain-containing protein [Pedobacter nototheniae]|uniref:PIN-like domain-containing protein n=1 Tax=Pedobacter nototheniae TaxID=2488994 RepID=UPI00103BEC31|nr:PIN-like domain-containing protein [Pedobacter nototheniae]